MLTRIISSAAAATTRRQLRRFLRLLPQCRTTQQKLLATILRTNRASDFGRRHRFHQLSSYSDFTAALPLANYQYFAPYIDRCRQGETSALFGPSQRIIMFAMTSGTTAAAKYIPVTAATAAAYRRGWHIWGIKAISDHYSPSRLRRILQVTSPHDEQHTSAGTPCGAISGLLAANQKPIVRRLYATPPAVAYIPAPTARYYTIMRLAICHDVGFISTANPSTTVTLARTAEHNATDLIRDLHDGALNDSLDLPTSIRNRLASRLRPNQRRAAELEGLLTQHGRLLPRHYWNLAFLANWTGGTLSLYLPQLTEYYGDTPIRDIGLLASEGRISIPVQDNTPAGILDITANFYEFVPADQYDALDDPDAADTLPDHLTPLTADQLQTGQEYYIFLTNFAGLYRYNLGDRIRVADFQDATPIIEFLSKGAHIASLTGEKLTEKQLVDAVRAVATELSLDMTSFIAAPIFAAPPHYRLYFETSATLDPPRLDKLTQHLDQRLCLANIEYQSKRKSQRLGPIDTHQLPTDYLAQRDQTQIKNNQGRAEQFKHRFLYNAPLHLTEESSHATK